MGNDYRSCLQYNFVSDMHELSDVAGSCAICEVCDLAPIPSAALSDDQPEGGTSSARAPQAKLHELSASSLAQINSLMDALCEYSNFTPEPTTSHPTVATPSSRRRGASKGASKSAAQTTDPTVGTQNTAAAAAATNLDVPLRVAVPRGEGKARGNQSGILNLSLRPAVVLAYQ